MAWVCGQQSANTGGQQKGRQAANVASQRTNVTAGAVRMQSMVYERRAPRCGLLKPKQGMNIELSLKFAREKDENLMHFTDTSVLLPLIFFIEIGRVLKLWYWRS